MPIQKTKDVEINGNTYRLHLLPAVFGNWAITEMAAGKGGDQEVFGRIQTEILNRVSVLQGGDTGEPIPVKIFANGKWLVPNLDLEFDIDTVNTICMEALEFNFGPFFAKQEKLAAASRAQATNQ